MRFYCKKCKEVLDETQVYKSDEEEGEYVCTDCDNHVVVYRECKVYNFAAEHAKRNWTSVTAKDMTPGERQIRYNMTQWGKRQAKANKMKQENNYSASKGLK
jgi:NAD-dependent SIR2 family protein deacetylase